MSPLDDADIERMISAIGAPPDAPMVMLRQELEWAGARVLHGLVPRLLGLFMSRAGQ
ncbi:hypothetical protein [Yoonia sp.]|jgi:hypothetical protein|uniref:hypothetical protein n=1 Tax=Yoonia sp. TaxID=2212373 RepID=UPI003D51068C